MAHSISIARALGASTTSRTLQWDGVAYVPQPVAVDTSAVRVFRGWADPSKEGHTLIAGDQWKRLSDTAPTRNVILDTDASTDLDDLFDIKTALVLAAENMHNLIGVAVTTSNDYAPGVVAAMADHYGVTRPPIASYAPIGTFNPGATATLFQTLYGAYSHTGIGLASTVTDSTTGYRTWLAGAPDGSVEVLMTGFAKGVVNALQSPADGISTLTGSQLFAAKVTRIVACAGNYPSGTEFNIQQNATDWDWLNTNSPVPIVWVDVAQGTTTPPLTRAYLVARRPSPDICLAGLDAWTAQYAGETSRPLWGVIAAQYALEGPDRYAFATVNGTNSINTGTGANTFTAGAGSQSYVKSTLYNGMSAGCSSLVAADLVTGNKTWNGSAWT